MAFDPLSWIDEELDALEQAGLRRTLRARCGRQAPVIQVDGRDVLNFGSNDYLGIAGERLGAVVSEALPEHGWGSGASPLVTGRGSLHEQLESELAEFEGTEAALLFPSGYAANVGAVTSLVGQGDIIFSDAKNHASIIDGCRLSRARVQVYPHRDVGYLRTMINQAGRFRRRLIVTDGLFSMDGNLAPLVELSELASEHDAILMVDEAHATGVFGPGGRGVAEHMGVDARVDVRVGTLSKALGSIGGFVAGSRALVKWLANRARTYVFSTASPAPVAAAGLEALRIVRDEPDRRATVLSLAERLREELMTRGWNVGESESQIVPVYLGDPDTTMEAAARLDKAGLFVPGIRPPSVPEGESLLRISLSAAHTTEMIERLIESLR